MLQTNTLQRRGDEELREERTAGDDGNATATESQLQSIIETRGRMGSLMGVSILGSGAYVPDNIVTNEDLAQLGCDSEWIIRRTGISERRHAFEGQATSDLCVEAATRCLDDAGVGVGELDLILVATITPDHPTPSTACHVQQRLGALAPAMDIGAACAGFMYALTTASQFIANGNAKRVLVIGADLMSRTVNPNDPKTYPLFGDGAGAVILGPSPAGSDGENENQPGILSYQLGSEGCGGEMLCIPAGGTRLPLTEQTREDGLQYLRMDGRNVFKWAVRVFDESAKDVMTAANVTPEELSMVILHQANQRIIDSAVAGLGVPEQKVFVNLDRYGNTSGASIPIALDEVLRQGSVGRGDYVLLCGFGSGLAWGTALMRL